MRENEKNAPRCGGCRYFIQHYRRDADGTYAPINCGHCVRSRVRQRKNAGKACADYAPSGEFEMEGKRVRQVSSNIEEELLLRLRDIAARERRTVSGQIRVLIRDFVQAYGDPAAKTAPPRGNAGR